LKQTGSVLDLAIEGQGMFALRDENNPGELIYTRDGAFRD
jgi:flagellar basal body rod protein FlgG